MIRRIENALEAARAAGWDDVVDHLEAALAAARDHVEAGQGAARTVRVSILASYRHRRLQSFALVGIPGTGQLEYADRIDGADVEGGRDNRRVTLDLPEGAVIIDVDVEYSRRGKTVSRTAYRVETPDEYDGGVVVDYTDLPTVPVGTRRRNGGWVTVVDGVEWDSP